MPNFTLPNEASYSVDQLDGGRAIYNSIFSRMDQGLPEDIKRLLTERGISMISGNTQAAKQAITEAGGDAPGTSGLSALGRVYAQSGKDLTGLNTDIALKDYEARNTNYERAINNYNSLINSATNLGQVRNQFGLGRAQMANDNELKQYQIDEANKFSWGDLAGSVLGAAGQVGAAGITKCCFIFMEAYDYNLPPSVRICRDYYYEKYPAVALGYKKMAKWLVPMMQKSKIVRNAVKYLMVKPITRYGEYLVGNTDKLINKACILFKEFWFIIWKLGGK